MSRIALLARLAISINLSLEVWKLVVPWRSAFACMSTIALLGCFKGQRLMEEDAFLAFVESARQMLVQLGHGSYPEHIARVEETSGPSWGWVFCRIFDCLKAYSSGVTPAILLSDLLKAWLEKSKVENGWNCKETGGYNSPGMAVYKRQKQLRTRLSNVVTIDSIYEKCFISFDAVLEVVILNIQLLSGTSSYILTLGDAWSTNTIDMYLHRKFYDLVDEQKGIMKKGREVRLTGCRLRTAVVAGSSQTRLLPTEYLVVLLDEEQDDDALLLGARFYSDTFSNIQIGSLEAGAEYCFYARLEKIGEVEFHPQWNHVKQQTLFLTDQNHASMHLILWDEQVSLASLFSQGSMVALERPFISQTDPSNGQQDFAFFLEYGSASRIYTVPFIHDEEQVMLGTASQERFKLSSGSYERSPVIFSQLMLPRDSQGCTDYCNFPVQLMVSDLRPKMSNISLFGVVRSFTELDVASGRVIDQIVGSGLNTTNLHQMTLEDQSGSVVIHILFLEGRKYEKLDIGHTIFISGLKSLIGPSDMVDCFWNERETMAQLVNITQLPALLTSPCLYQLVPLRNLSKSCIGVQVCRVVVKDLKVDYVCQGSASVGCSESQAGLSFLMVLELYNRHDEMDGVCMALCFGQPATDILQASYKDFLCWPEDEQALYLYGLQSEEYIATIAQITRFLHKAFLDSWSNFGTLD
ncbi:hypothetical protein GOP47_0004120 [Adiantum capillus-veneris]|uniref:Uncharacterized protein n=1 Tax=Adiantum capillus-veneris TaxID=13818 RepID=A0A9D4V8P0_ADICA|nr:hypothetical protein GOP47_0004120 [Adiantum capillus-veneris]